MSEKVLVLKMPRWGLPLYGQVLTWFFINIGIVAFLFWLLMRLQFGVSLSDLFAEQLRGRVEPRTELVATELRESGRELWGSVLESSGEELGVRLAVYTLDDEWFNGAGLPQQLREEAVVAVDKMKTEDLPPRRRDERGSSGEYQKGGRRGPGGDRMGPPPRATRPPARLVFASKGNHGSQWAGVEIYLGGDPHRHPPRAVLVAYSKERKRNELFVDFRPLVATGVGLIVFSGLLWLPFVHRVTKRLRVMAEGAEKISEGDFKVNVASPRGDEIGRLSRVIQRMAGRLEVLVDGQKRFLGDTAHELCSPLVRVRMGLGVLEQRLEGADRDRLQNVEDEVGELARLVDELLAFSKASLAKGDVGKEPVFVHELCYEVTQRECLGNEFTVEGGQGLELYTSPDLLRRALGNLVRNAARYGEGSPLKVKIEKHGEEVWIGVLDRGPGLPEGWSERVFEPFARPEAARTREGGGAGLGLAIVKTCAESLGGRVFCRNRQTGGLEVVLVIPFTEPVRKTEN
ncbi:sensor histidine kinase [Roseibacillus persicicus]|uniref:histidine kinase n=1 Tax=Roseibacillus persicicus TaxID=454148 RepID=A0A918WRF7_9BACT|nr:HAMP domain-containing sensor histidine kinase [Roseibacillus persicicus]GHC67642.1 hypothetical protein GCM10007100_39660 [Roseibacillus persicicus]